jgi:hypothetical protein
MANSFKKAFSTFVSLTTIAWSVGAGSLALPSVASAATLSSGDLIKASGPAVYYYAADGKRYVFPNEKTYFSWYMDFSTVKTISDSELAAIGIGGNVTIRPGTKLVKIQTDPKVYAVTRCGTLHWVESEAVAKALYGDAWAMRVVDVPDSFFVNYTIGSSVSTNVHPDGTLVTYSGDTNKYVVWNGAKRKFASDAAFAANMFSSANSIMTTISYGNGSDVTGWESDLGDVVCGATAAPVSGALTVALASDTPAGMTVPKNASSVKLIKVNLTAGTSDVTVSGLRFHRVGVGSVGDFSNVYLYDANGLRLTTGRTINSSTNIVEFNNLNAVVKAGMTWSVYVYGDFSSPSTTGGEHAFELVDAASVVVSGNATISGSFPVRGNVFKVGTSSSARVDVQKGSTPANPTIGAKGVEISNFKVTANTNDVTLQQVTLYQAGTITNGDLSNFKLYQGTTLVAEAAGVASNGRIVLKFTTPYVVGNGTTKVFSLKADVAGRADRTIRTYVEYTTDVTAMDNMFNAGAQVCINSSASGCSGSSANFDGTSTNYVEVTTQGGQLTNAFNGPATSNVSKGQLAVPLYKFTLTSPDNALEIRKMVFTIQKTSGAACKVVGSSGTRYFRSIKIKNLDSGTTVMGPQETGTVSSTSETLTFTDSFNINAAQTLNLALVADLSNSEDAAGEFFTNGDCQYKASFTAFGSSDVRVVDTGEFLSTSKIVPNSNVTGNAITVKSSTLSVNLASSPNSGTVVKKQQNVAIAGLTFSASAESDVTITNLTLTGRANINGAGYTLAGFAQRVTSVSLWDGTTQVGQAKSPDTTTGAAQISNMNLVIPKGTTKTLTVKASFGSDVTVGGTNDKVAVGIATTGDIQAQDQDSNTVTPSLSSSVSGNAGTSPTVSQTLINSGVLSVQSESHPTSNIVVAGKDAWVPFAQYKATAQYEDIMIDRMAIFASSTYGADMADNADFTAVAVASGGAVKGQDVLSSGSTGTKEIDLSSNMITVPKDNSVTFQLWAKLSAVSPSSSVNGAMTGVARSGHAPALGLASSTVVGEFDSSYTNKVDVRATGAASGERVYANSGATHGNSMVLRKTMPVVTKQSLSSTTLANIDQDLMKFQVAADSAGAVALKQVTFQYSKTSSVSLSNFRLRRGATDLTGATYAVTSDIGTDLQSGSLAAASTTGYIVVSFVEGQEESISGSGNVYTIHATVSGAAAGQNVTFSFYRNGTAPVTGYLVSNVAQGVITGASANVFHIDTAVAPDGSADATGSFVWSDNSEVPHSSASGAGSSRDWTNDLYVQDLSQSQTLSL